MEKKEKKPAGYWTKEKCYEEAKKYSYITEFLRACAGAYNVAWKNKWLKDYTWFMSKGEAVTKARTKWTYEACYELATKYKTRMEIKNASQGAYDAIRSNGWMKDYTWLEPSKSAEKWTYEACYEEAKKYETKSDFMEHSSGAAAKAYKKGWMKDYTWLDKRVYKGSDYWVYAYEDKINKVVYVGLTFRKERHTEHKGPDDVVRKYFKNNIPEQRVLIDGLNAEDAQYYEDWYKEKYIEDGWKVLNKAKTGVGSSSLGASNYKWNHESCYEAAKKCSSKGEFAIKYDGASRLARRMGWISEYTWFEELKKPNNTWTYEACYEEAQKYKSRKELEDNNGTVYKKVTENGWIEDYTWFKPVRSKPRGYWTYERVREEALKYNRIIDFEKSNHPAYTAAWRNKWLKDYTWFESTTDVLRKVHKKWTYERCYEEAKKYKSRTQFARGKAKAYETARENGWLDDYDWFIPTHELLCNREYPRKWVYETCYAEASKYKTRGAYASGSGSSYDVARRNGWLDEFFPKAA